jgi:hypothetical protein
MGVKLALVTDNVTMTRADLIKLRRANHDRKLSSRLMTLKSRRLFNIVSLPFYRTPIAVRNEVYARNFAACDGRRQPRDGPHDRTAFLIS